MNKKQVAGAFCAGVLSLAIVSTADAALFSRMGGAAYYDDQLDITWLADANLAETNAFGVAYNTELGQNINDNGIGGSSNIIQTNGRMTWGAALTWLDAMNADNGTGYLGFNDWRLPTMIDNGGDGCNLSNSGGTDCGYNVLTGSASTTIHSEMASLYYDTLGNLGLFDTNGDSPQPGFGLDNSGPFSNIQTLVYWTGVEDVSSVNISQSWIFGHSTGNQDVTNKANQFFAWAVRSGDVSVVPVPAAVWLFGSGFIGLIGFARRKKA